MQLSKKSYLIKFKKKTASHTQIHFFSPEKFFLYELTILFLLFGTRLKFGLAFFCISSNSMSTQRMQSSCPEPDRLEWE